MLGISYSSGQEKKYLLGKYPMADVFLAWSNAIEPADLEKHVKGNWRWKFQILSCVLVAFIGLIFFKGQYRK